MYADANFLCAQIGEKADRRAPGRALGFLRPDGKTQVTVRYENGAAVCIDSIVVSSQHDEDVSLSAIREGIMEEVIYKTVPRELLAPDVSVYINPTGRFVIGGPHGDSGVTGRKIIVDTYGGSGRHGGGSFSGKDPTKVDRSAAYAGAPGRKDDCARWPGRPL